MSLDNAKIVHFKYSNYKGESKIRSVIPIEIWFGVTEYHVTEQWLLKAYDLEKQDYRNFSMKDIKSWNEELV